MESFAEATDTLGELPTLSAKDALALGRLADALRAVATGDEAMKLLIEVAGTGGSAVTPASAIRLVCDLLEDLSEGRKVTIAPYEMPVGTEAAGELLGVSRPWVTTLVDRGDVPGVRVGSKRRIRLGDLISFRRADDARRRDAASDWSFLDEPTD